MPAIDQVVVELEELGPRLARRGVHRLARVGRQQLGQKRDLLVFDDVRLINRDRRAYADIRVGTHDRVDRFARGDRHVIGIVVNARDASPEHLHRALQSVFLAQALMQAQA